MAQAIGNLLLDFGLLVLFIVPLVFVSNKVYKDGVLGRISLATISITSLTLFCEHRLFQNDPNTMMMLFTLLVLAVAGFLCWHLWRFHARVLAQHNDQTMVGPAFKLVDGMVRRRAS